MSGAPAADGRRGASVEIKNMRRHFAETGPVIEPLEMTIQPGEFVALLGPSGCGKSTLLRLIAGLDEPDAGQIATEAFGRRFFRGYVFQDAHLLPWRNVLENCALPFELMRRPDAETRREAERALEKVGLGDALAKFPNQLSGGMKMRVSLARALVNEPSLLLLDEPFAALDETARFRLQEELRALWLKLGMTVVFVTHSISEAAFLADRAIVFSKRPARVLLDRRLGLPRERGPALRSDPAYLAEVATIGEAFRRGEDA